MTAPTMPVDLDGDLLAQCEQIWAATEAAIERDRRRSIEETVIRVWNGDWDLAHHIQDVYEFEFEWVDNDTGTGKTVHPYDSPAAIWLQDMHGRILGGEKRNVHITADKNGARWGGRLDDVTTAIGDDGVVVVEVTWLHDYENLKWYTCWSNPFLPAAIQFPRIWFLPGPARWALLTTLFVNILRDQASLWALPDDPLDPAGWFNLDQSTWSIVCAPLSFMQDMAAGTLWAMPVSRFKNWHDIAKPTLLDAELSVRCERWLDGDPEPWPGANLRHGTLVVSIVDQSGVHTGTSHGGTLFDGLLRTVAEFADDFIDSTLNLVADNDIPVDYFLPGVKLTRKELPGVIYRPGITPGVVSASHTQTPAKGVQVVTGGHSMPGVNEAISASIQAAGDIIGTLLHFGAVGGAIDTLLKPLYEDTILAWMSVKSLQRAQHSGWSRYFEHFVDGADKAYTLSSLMVLRAGFWATRTWFSHEIKIIDHAPWLIGDRGRGHFFIGDRIGSTLPGDPSGRFEMDRVTRLKLHGTRDAFDDWTATIGNELANLDPMVMAMDKIKTVMSAAHDLGVF